MSRTQLSYLDLAAFYMSAKANYEGWPGLRGFSEQAARWCIRDLSSKLLAVIDAIRNDGLDPRWNPERDACIGAYVRGTINGPNGTNTDYVIKIDLAGACDIAAHLHQRGYKIVKDDD